LKTQLIYLVRHGETNANKFNIYQGHGQDNSLNATGRKQAELLGKWLKLHKKVYPTPSIIFTSPAKRALETTAIIKNELVGMAREPKIIVLPKLHEINHGHWEGLSDKQLKKKYPKPYRLWRTNPMKMKFPKGETMKKAKKRILKVWRDEILEYQDGHILIVAHGGVNFQIINDVLESDKLRNTRQDNACLNIIELPRMRMALVNSTAHLF